MLLYPIENALQNAKKSKQVSKVKSAYFMGLILPYH